MSDTNISNLVDKATSEYLIGTDWAINMQLCDHLTNDPQKSKEIIHKVTKKLKEKKARVLLLALELLETLVKNCEAVHPFVGSKESQAELIKLAQNSKTKDNVRERTLELIQYWADNFSKKPDLPLFNQTYMLLRRAGVPFPPRRKDEVPLVFKNPPAARPLSVSASERQAYPNPTGPTVGGLSKDFSSLREGISLATEMLAFSNPEEEDPNSNDILKEIIQTCKNALPNVRAAIESGNFTSEDAMLEMISLNDELVKVQEMFDDVVVRRESFLVHGPSRTTPLSSSSSTSPSPYSSQNNSALLDLTNDFGNLRIPQPVGLDGFDLLGSRPSAPAATRPAANPPYNPFGGNPPQSAPATASSTSASNDFDEFDLLANRHSTQLPAATSSLPSMNSLPPLSSNPTGSLAYGQNTSPFTQSVLPPLKSSQPLATSPPAQSLIDMSSTTQSMGPGRPMGQPYPAYGVAVYPAATVAPVIYPMQPQPMMGTPYGVPYGSYTPQMPQYYPQMGTGVHYPNLSTNNPPK